MILNYEERQQVRRTRAFQWTNNLWNKYRFNAGWSIGLTSRISYEKEFSNRQEWEDYYFESGMARQERLKKTIPSTYKRLIQLREVYTNSQTFKRGLTNYEININEGYGRTIEELKVLAKSMHDVVIELGNPYQITEEDCLNFILIRVIDESYIGIARETHTIKTLESEYPNLNFKHTDPVKDKRYAVDVEVFNSENKLLCGLQIKSEHFSKGKLDAMIQAQHYNLRKHKEYTTSFKVPAYFVQATVDGEILNQETFEILNELSNTKSLQTI